MECGQGLGLRLLVRSSGSHISEQIELKREGGREEGRKRFKYLLEDVIRCSLEFLIFS